MTYLHLRYLISSTTEAIAIPSLKPPRRHRQVSSCEAVIFDISRRSESCSRALRMACESCTLRSSETWPTLRPQSWMAWGGLGEKWCLVDVNLEVNSWIFMGSHEN